MATIAFDAVGTLFSLDAPRRKLVSAGAPEQTLELWVSQTLRTYFELAHAGEYAPLEQILETTLPDALAAVGVALDDDEAEALIRSFKRLEPADEASEACRRLQKQESELMVVTNLSRGTAIELLEDSGLEPHFDQILSCEQIGTCKPHPNVYRTVEKRAAERVWMVAAHGWDVSRAKYAGLRTVWVSTLESPYPDVFPEPDFEADDLADAAEHIANHPRAQKTTA